MKEIEIVQAIRVALAKIEGVTVWRNNTGKLQDNTGRWVAYGLGIGSADLVGVCSIDHLGYCEQPGSIVPGPVGRFFALEVKVPGRHEEPDQLRWASHVRSLGGFAATVRSAEEAVDAVRRCRAGEHR